MGATGNLFWLTYCLYIEMFHIHPVPHHEIFQQRMTGSRINEAHHVATLPDDADNVTKNLW